MIECWKDILGYPGYKISNSGRVISLPKLTFNGKGWFVSKERFITPRLDSKGYFQMGLTNDKKRRHLSCHRLVATHFICPSPFPDAQINHIDGNKQNNHVSNLEWVTSFENIRHAFKNGLNSVDKRTTKPNRMKSKDALFIKNSLESNSKLAIMFDVHISTVQRIKKGKMWSNIK